MYKKFLLYFLGFLITLNNLLLPAKSEEVITEQTVLKGTASISDVIPKNTKLKVSINTEIDALTNQAGDEISATVLNDLNINDENLIPVGSLVLGHIENITHAGKRSKQGVVEISLDKIVLPSGKYIPLSGARFAADSKYTNKNRNLKVKAMELQEELE